MKQSKCQNIVASITDSHSTELSKYLNLERLFTLVSYCIYERNKLDPKLNNRNINIFEVPIFFSYQKKPQFIVVYDIDGIQLHTKLRLGSSNSNKTNFRYNFEVNIKQMYS